MSRFSFASFKKALDREVSRLKKERKKLANLAQSCDNKVVKTDKKSTTL